MSAAQILAPWKERIMSRRINRDDFWEQVVQFQNTIDCHRENYRNNVGKLFSEYVQSYAMRDVGKRVSKLLFGLRKNGKKRTVVIGKLAKAIHVATSDPMLLSIFTLQEKGEIETKLFRCVRDAVSSLFIESLQGEEHAQVMSALHAIDENSLFLEVKSAVKQWMGERGPV